MTWALLSSSSKAISDLPSFLFFFPSIQSEILPQSCPSTRPASSPVSVSSLFISLFQSRPCILIWVFVFSSSFFFSSDLDLSGARMGMKWALLFLVSLIVLGFGNVDAKKKEKVCDKGWECKGSIYCCNHTISDFFETYQFENLFAKRNSPVAHAVGFWDYKSFITASTQFQPLGFGTTGGKVMQMKEIAAFLGHVGSKTSCGYGVATGGPLAWGLCYNHEMSPSQSYCNEDYLYPCTPGAEYYGRGALPVYWNYNYGVIGEGLKLDLLSHPEYLEQNATIAFQAAMWRWMNPMKKKQPSAHDAFVGNWKPTKNDTLAKRVPGFGTTMNVLYGDLVCGQGDADSMNNIVSHYLYYLDLMGVGREEAGSHDVLTCAEQAAFNPSTPTQTAST